MKKLILGIVIALMGFGAKGQERNQNPDGSTCTDKGQITIKAKEKATSNSVYEDPETGKGCTELKAKPLDKEKPKFNKNTSGIDGVWREKKKQESIKNKIGVE